MTNAIKTPNKTDQNISIVKWLWANSSPPLNPMENSKYREINFEEFSGISKSLFNLTASTPKIKNSNAGLVRFSKSKSKFIVY